METTEAIAQRQLVAYLTKYSHKIPYKELFSLLNSAKTVFAEVVVRLAIQMKEADKVFDISLEEALAKTERIIKNRRKRFVKRTWKSTPMLALSVIRERYPDYTEEMLLADLAVNKRYKKKERFVKRPSENGFRISQIRKLTSELRFGDASSAEYHKHCNKIVGYANGIKERAPILLQVRYGGVQKEYSFPWNETEHKVKSFVNLCNRVKSFEELDEKCGNFESAGK